MAAVPAGLTVVGMQETLAILHEWPRKTQTRINRKVVRAAAAPLVKAARRRVPRRYGPTRSAMTQVVRTYPSGTVVSVVGQERRGSSRRSKARGGPIGGGLSGQGTQVPIHWFERGVKPHNIRSRSGRTLAMPVKGSGLRFAAQVRHPGFRAMRVLSGALSDSRSAMQSAMHDKARQEVEAEAAKAASGGGRR